MMIRDWRLKQGLSLAALAEQIGAANASVVARWENGAHLPRPAEMRRIFEITGGAVTPNDFYGVAA